MRMGIGNLGTPTELRRRLEYVLPRQDGLYPPVVRVTRRDRAERKCAAWAADHYEVQAYYTTTDAASLDALEDALKATPGVYLTTQVRPLPGLGTEFTNPAWPAALGAGRRDRHSLRAQVIALMGEGAMADWKPGDRVIVRLPDAGGSPRGRLRDFCGTVRAVDEPGLWPGVRVDLDHTVNGIGDCYASHRELRPAGDDDG